MGLFGWNNGEIARAEKAPLDELGATGVDVNRPSESEFLRDLKGPNAAKVYKQMSENDAVVGAFLLVWEFIVRQISWSVKPAEVDNEQAAEDAAQFIRECQLDMEQPWSEVINDAISMLVYGYSLQEKVFKIRGGEVADPTKRSRYNDRKIGWRKFAARGQETVVKWNGEEHGEIVSIDQRVGQKIVTIPYQKLMHYRTSSRRGNPLGKSMLRNAYRAWFRKTRIEDIEAIGIERDLTGYPVMWVPVEWLSRTATQEQRQTVDTLREIVVNIRRDRLEGAVLPRVYTEQGNKLIDFELLASPGKRQFDTTQIIQRYDTQILLSVLADFLMLGHTKVGTQALTVEKTQVFKLAVKTVIDEIAQQFNNDAIPELLAYNGIPREYSPTLEYSDILTLPIDDVIKAIADLSRTGADVGQTGIVNHLLRRLGVPELDPDLAED